MDAYLKPLRAGRDFAVGDRFAEAMGNRVYLLGDPQVRQCLVIDPAWDIDGILACAEADGYRVVGALVTHWHPDHVGGTLVGHQVPGLPELLARAPGPIWVHRDDADLVSLVTGVSASDLRPVGSGDKVRVGAIEVECLHTPGHTKGSMCFRCGQALISGDTVFLQGCGRTDLPGGDIEEMWRTLYERLLTLPSDLVLYPGHAYGGEPPASLAEVRRSNQALQAPDREAFLQRFGR